MVVWGDADVAIAVALALFAACSTATLIAMLLFWLFNRAGADLAFGSGLLATVVQDLLSLLIYFAVAGRGQLKVVTIGAPRHAGTASSSGADLWRSAVPPARGRARCRRS